MFGRIIVCSILLIAVTAWGNPSREVYGMLTPIAELGPGIQDIQLSQSLVLPPYGVKITAQTATLTLHISSSQEGAVARFEDVQGAVDIIDNLAAENTNISAMEVSVSPHYHIPDSACHWPVFWVTPDVIQVSLS